VSADQLQQACAKNLYNGLWQWLHNAHIGANKILAELFSFGKCDIAHSVVAVQKKEWQIWINIIFDSSYTIC
jgi:hypothetical protein